MRLLLTTITLAALGATAHANNNELAIGSSTRGLQSASANALTADDLDGGGLTYARQLPLATVPGLAVWAEVGFGWGSANGTMFQVLTTELDTTYYTLGGRARYTIHPRVIASARVGFGAARASMSLADMAGHSASDTGTGGIATGALGLDLLAITHRSFALGLRVELGYVAASAVQLTATPDRAEDTTIKLPMSDASFGHLDLGGPSFGFSIISQF